MESLTVNNSGQLFGECHTPCMLKTSFVDFEKRVDTLYHYKILNFSLSTQPSTLFQWQSKVVDPVEPFLPSFLSSLYILLLNLLSSEKSEILLLGNNQSTNLRDTDMSFALFNLCIFGDIK